VPDTVRTTTRTRYCHRLTIHIRQPPRPLRLPAAMNLVDCVLCPFLAKCLDHSLRQLIVNSQSIMSFEATRTLKDNFHLFMIPLPCSVGHAVGTSKLTRISRHIAKFLHFCLHRVFEDSRLISSKFQSDLGHSHAQRLAIAGKRSLGMALNCDPPIRRRFRFPMRAFTLAFVSAGCHAWNLAQPQRISFQTSALNSMPWHFRGNGFPGKLQENM